MKYYDPQSNGTDKYWQHPLWNYNITDSVYNFCTEYKAFWTLDLIGSFYTLIKQYPFLVISFDVVDNKCLFYVQEDTDTERVVEKYIPFTDLEVSIKMYLIDSVLMFPSDY